MEGIDARGFTGLFVKPTLAAGTTTTLSFGGNLDYSIQGKIYYKAAVTNGATPTTDYGTGAAFLGIKANYGGVFVICLDSSGAFKVVQGEIVALDAAGAFVNAPEFPLIPAGICPIGYELIQAGSTADATTGWVMGSSNQSSVTGITYTLVDVCTLPSRPQIS
jgi:hypothetical protein